LLFETGLPVRTYIPKTDVKMQYLEPSDFTTECPYKVCLCLLNIAIPLPGFFPQGIANYYHLVLDGVKTDNFFWWYRAPHRECSEIQGWVSFLSEKVDMWVDGEVVDAPTSRA